VFSERLFSNFKIFSNTEPTLIFTMLIHLLHPCLTASFSYSHRWYLLLSVSGSLYPADIYCMHWHFRKPLNCFKIPGYRSMDISILTLFLVVCA